MKILMICEFFDPDLEFQENIAFKYYRKHGHDVRILTSTYSSVFDYYACRHDNTAPESSFKYDGGEIVRLPFRYNLLHKVRAYAGVKRHLDAFQPDLIFVHDISPNFPECVRYMRSHPDCRMIMDYHADYSNSGRNWLSLKLLHGIIRKYFLDRARPYLSRIFSVVPNGFVFLNEVYKVPMEEMELLPLGADLDLIKEIRSESNTRNLRSKYDLGSDDFVIVTGGKLEPRKKIELLIKAIQSEQLHNVKVLVIGEFPPEADDYRDTVMSSVQPVADRVHFTGWQSRDGVYQHMLISDLAVFPASQSVLWQKAIACGLPLVCGNTGNQDLSYLNLYDNIRIQHGDEINADGYRSVIEQLVASPNLLASMAEGAQTAAKELLNWDLLIEQTTRFNNETHPVGAGVECSETA